MTENPILQSYDRESAPLKIGRDFQNSDQYGWKLWQKDSGLVLAEYVLDNFMPPYHIARDLEDNARGLRNLELTFVPVETSGKRREDFEKSIDVLIERHVLV